MRASRSIARQPKPHSPACKADRSAFHLHIRRTQASVPSFFDAASVTTSNFWSEVLGDMVATGQVRPHPPGQTLETHSASCFIR